MPVNSVEVSHVHNTMSNNWLLLANNVLLATMLACPMIPGLSRHFANTYICIGIILLLVFLNYWLYRLAGNKSITADCNVLAEIDRNWKSKVRVLAWSVLVPSVMLLGAGPIVNPSAYAVDKFTRVFGQAIAEDYSVSKKIHYFYFSIIILGLLVFNFYLNIRIIFINNLKNKIRRVGEFADTLLFVGYSFLLICTYRQFSNQYSSDLTLYLLKCVLIFSIPAFYFLQRGKLNLPDIRVVLALVFFSLVISIDLILYYGSSFVKFNDVLTIVFMTSSVIFLFNKTINLWNCKKLYSKIMVMALIGSFAIVFYSIFLEFSNVLAFKTGKFVDVQEINHIVFGIFCIVAYYWIVRKNIRKNTVGLALFLFVLGASLIQFQPSLLISSELHLFESANSAVPVSDFLNFGKIPLFENFPGHGLNGVISSVAYGLLTSDYDGAIYGPWRNWLYCSLCILALYSFTKIIANGLVAISVSILFPYFLLTFVHEYSSYCGVGLFAVIPFIFYLKTLRSRYLIWTVLVSLFLVAYKLDIGVAFFIGILCSSFCVSKFYGSRIIFRISLSFVIGIAVIFVFFLVVCFIKHINPILRIQEFISIASSNDHWGYSTLGDTEKNSYHFVYYVVPVLSVICFVATVVFKTKLGLVNAAVSFCLIFAYFANIHRSLVMHSLMQYNDIFLVLWLWTIPFAFPFLMSRLFSSRSLVILCQTCLVLLVYIFFQATTYYNDSPLQNLVNRALMITAEISPEVRQNDISFVARRGSRISLNRGTYCGSSSENMFHAQEIKTIADSFLSSNETYLDFTTMSAVYAVSRRENPVYVVQSPSVLSGEKSQKAFIREIESNLDNVPIAIMPANNAWCFVMNQNTYNYNMWHYLVSEWIYNNYRPLFKYNDFASVWVLNSRYDEFYSKLSNNDVLTKHDIPQETVRFDSNLKEIQNSGPWDCTVKTTDAGLQITPTGGDPQLSDFGKLIGTDDLNGFDYLTLYLADKSTADFQLFWTNDEVKNFSEEYSLRTSVVAPGIVVFDLKNSPKSIGHTNRIRLDLSESGNTTIQSVSLGNTFPLQVSLIDWGYDNFVSMPKGAAPALEYISSAHDYSIRFLPYIWGQFDTKKASNLPDLVNISALGDLYTWSYANYKNKPAYLRVDLSISPEFLKHYWLSYFTLGTLEGEQYTPLSKFSFKLKEGKNVYLFRISADYYWFRGKFNALSLDPNLCSSVTSVRILEGD